MAIYNVTLEASEGAFTDRLNPNNNYKNSTLKVGDSIPGDWYTARYISYLKFGTSSIEPYTKKNLDRFSWNFYLTESVPQRFDIGGRFYEILGPWDASTLTFNNAPRDGESVLNASTSPDDSRASGWQSIEGEPPQKVIPEKLYEAMSSYGLMLYDSTYVPDDPPYEDGWGIKNVFNSPQSSREPYFKFTFEDYSPTPKAAFPISGAFIDYLHPNRFTVEFVRHYAMESPVIVSFKVQYRTGGVTTEKIYPVSVDLYNPDSEKNLTADIPVASGDLEHGKNYQWRACFTTNDGITTPYSEWASFTTVDVTPNAPVIKSPQSSYLDASQAMSLIWKHDIDTGSTQYAYDLDYKQSDGVWVSIGNHVVSSAQTYTIPANTLQSGSFVWRVRTYNSDNVVGPYAESTTNMVQSRPAPPVISSVTTKPNIAVAWQSSGQQAYELYIGSIKIYNWGVDKTYTHSDYLPDGWYEIRMRIQNSQGLWSDYATLTVQVRNQPLPGEDVLSASQVPGGVRLRISYPKTAWDAYLNEYYVGEIYAMHTPKQADGMRYILRDGVPIAKIEGMDYIDYTAAGTHEYVMRVIKNGYYYDTPAVIAAPSIKYGVISPAEAPGSIIPLAYRLGSKPQPQEQISKGYNPHYFSGRQQPVFDITEHFESAWQIENTMTFEDYKKVKEWMQKGKSVLVRYNDGTKLYGIIQPLSKVKVIGNIVTVSFTLLVHDKSEVIAYV